MCIFLHECAQSEAWFDEATILGLPRAYIMLFKQLLQLRFDCQCQCALSHSITARAKDVSSLESVDKLKTFHEHDMIHSSRLKTWTICCSELKV